MVSLDFDGNDLYLINELLNKNVKPDLYIIEYNAMFLPEIEFSIDYDSDHKWNNDDYFGVSLLSLKKLLNDFDYELICCNAATGSNAFFVKKESYGKFSDVPKEIANIYAEPFYYLPKKIGHSHSIKTLRKITH